MEWVKYSVWMCSSVDYGLYQGIVKLLQDSTSSYCVSPYSMQYIVHTAAVVSYTHIYCTSLCGQVSVATHHWRHNSDCSIIYMHSYSGTTLTQLLHFSLRTFFSTVIHDRRHQGYCSIVQLLQYQSHSYFTTVDSLLLLHITQDAALLACATAFTHNARATAFTHNLHTKVTHQSTHLRCQFFCFISIYITVFCCNKPLPTPPKMNDTDAVSCIKCSMCDVLVWQS